MTHHHGKVALDSDERWASVCDCGLVWRHAHWSDAFAAIFDHVRAARRAQALGIGFRGSKS